MKFEAFRNALANLIGGLIPAAVTLFTLPFIAHRLGSDNYGVLTLVSAIVGYFAILDINVTAGSVKFVAQHHATGSTRLRNQTITCGLAIYAAIGALGCVLLLLFADTLAQHVFAIPDNLHRIVTRTLRLAAFGFFVGQAQIYLNSIPQAIRRYDRTAMVESAFGIVVPLSTVGLLWLGYGLYAIVLVRVAASVLNVIVLSVVIRRLMPDIRFAWPDRTVIAELARFSGFSYLSRLAAVASAQADKLILGAMLSMSALTYYAIPATLVNRLFALSYRLGAVLFPLASALSAVKDTHRLRDIYLYGARYLLFVNCAITTILITLAYELLDHWIGRSLAATGAWILIILSLASLADSLSNVPSLVNDGLGHPKISGLFAITRAGIGISLTFALVARFNIEGAAFAQLITSITMSSAFLWFVHGRTVPVVCVEYLRKVILPVLPVIAIALGIAILRLRASTLGIGTTLGVLASELILLSIYGLLFVLRRDDRSALVVRASRMAHARSYGGQR